MGAGSEIYDTSYYPQQQSGVNPYGPCPTFSRFPSSSSNFTTNNNGGMLNGGTRGMPNRLIMDYMPMPCRTSNFFNGHQMGPYPSGQQQQQYMRSKRAQCPAGPQVGLLSF